MQELLISWALVIVCMTGIFGQEDINAHQRQLGKLKFVCEESAAGAAQFRVESQYSIGKYVFNQAESIKAAEYYIKKDLNLDNNFNPIGNNYWTDKITYTIEFFDDSNTAFPYLYKHPSGAMTQVLASPTIVITIYAGKPRYRNIKNVPNSFRIAAHAWKYIE
jgi:hypothetical protein